MVCQQHQKAAVQGGMVSLPALLSRFLFSAIMLRKAALISNFFQTICFLLQFHADYINQKNKLEQPTASLGWLSHANLPSSLSAPSTSVQPLKTENPRTEVPNPQQMLLLASTMSFC